MAEGIQDQTAELTDMAKASGHKSPIRHVYASPPPGAGWGEKEWGEYWQLYERALGLEKSPFSEAIHDKPGLHGRDAHRHRVYLALTERGTLVRLGHDYSKQEAVSRIMEFRTGQAFTKGKHNIRALGHIERLGFPEVAEAMRLAKLHEGPPAQARMTPKERAQQERTQISKADVAQSVSQAWQSSDNGQAFAHALRESGLILAMGDKSPVVMDQSGNVHAVSRMMAMSAKATGEPAPRFQDVAARLAGMELPTLDQAKEQIAHVPPVHDVAPIVAPEPPQPGGGEPVPVIEVPSQDTNAAPVFNVATPSNDDGHGQAMPAAAKAPKGAGGGGGGSSPSEAPQSPLPSMDVGAGPGEPPGPNATPDEKAKFAAKLADYEDRKTKAWLAWLKAWDAQNKPKKSAHSTGGGSDNVDEKRIREAASKLIQSITDAAERGAALRGFYAAFEAFRGDNAPGRRNEEPDRNRVAPERGPSGEGDRHFGGDESAPRNRRAEPDAGVDRRHGQHGGGVGTDREKSARNDVGARAESLKIGRAAALSDFSRLRAALSDLNPVPDPLEGLGPKERKVRLQEFRQDLLTLYRQDREVMREAGRTDWHERLAAEKMRASPLAEQLRTNWRHLSPEQREAGWKAIREAREALTSQMKEKAKANPAGDFRTWLEFVSETDPKASAVLTDMRAAEERKAKIQQELKLGDVRLEALRSTAPTGERDEEQAARDVKERMKDEHGQREEAAREARKKADEAASRVRWWMVWKSHPVRAVARAAHEHAETIEQAARIHAPSQTDFREAQETARSRARSNLRAFQAWEQSPKGVEASALEKSLQGIRSALAGKDVYMRNAILEGGIDGALDEQRRREALEQKRREIEQRNLERKNGHERGHVVQFPSGPRMR